MIIKEIDRKKGSSSSFVRLVDYITRYNPPLIKDINKKTLFKNGYVNITNFQTEDRLDIAKIQALSTQKMNTRSKADKTMHIVISFPKEDNAKLTPSLLNKIENTTLKELQLEDHQRISALQVDTSNIHLHIAINKVNPITYRNFSPHNSKIKLTKLGGKLENNLNLFKTNHDIESNYNKEKVTGKSADFEAHTGFMSIKSYMIEHKIKDIILNTDSWQSLHKELKKFDLTIKLKGNGLVIGSEKENTFIKCSDLHRSLSKNNLEKAFGKFTNFIKNDIKEPLKENIIEQKIPEFKYDKNIPKDISFNRADMDTNILWNQYQTYKKEQANSIYKQVNQNFKNLNKERKLAYEIMTKNFNIKKEQILEKFPAFTNDQKRYRNSLLRLLNKEKFKLSQTIKEKYQENLSIIEKQKQNIKNQPRLPALSWKDFLRREAFNGNSMALSKLQKMAKNKKYLNLFSLEIIDKNDLFNSDFKFNITKDGSIIYYEDDIRIEDSEKGITTSDVSEKAILASLKIATKKFGNLLKINGSDEYKASVVNIVAKYDLNINFDDQNLEKQKYFQIAANKKMEDTKTIEMIKEELLLENPNNKFVTYIKYNEKLICSFIKGKEINNKVYGVFEDTNQNKIIKKISLKQLNFFQSHQFEKFEISNGTYIPIYNSEKNKFNKTKNSSLQKGD